MPPLDNQNSTWIPPAAAAPPPGPILASATAWDLAASPTAVQDAAHALRARALRALSAQTTVDDSARDLIADQDWEGDSADRYQNHRRRLTGDLGELGALLGFLADTLDGIAAVLVSSQAMLDQEW